MSTSEPKLEPAGLGPDVEVDEAAKRVWARTPEKFLALWGEIMRLGIADPGDRFRCYGYEFGLRSGDGNAPTPAEPRST